MQVCLHVNSRVSWLDQLHGARLKWALGWLISIPICLLTSGKPWKLTWYVTLVLDGPVCPVLTQSAKTQPAEVTDVNWAIRVRDSALFRNLIPGAADSCFGCLICIFLCLTLTTPPPLPVSNSPLTCSPSSQDHHLVSTQCLSQCRDSVSQQRGVRSSQGWWPSFWQRWPHVKRVSAGVLSVVMCAKDLPPLLFEDGAFRGCEVQPFLFVSALFLWVLCGYVRNL